MYSLANTKYMVGVTYNVKNVDIIIPPRIVAPTASLEASPAPGPMLPITKRNHCNHGTYRSHHYRSKS